MPGMATVFPSQVLIFKAMLRNDIRRFALAEHAANLEHVMEMVRYHFDIEEGECFNVYYVNSIGDMLGLWSAEDFADACSHAKVKSDLERELVLVVDRAGLEPEMELPAIAPITGRMERLETDLLNSINEVNAILDNEVNASSPPRQLPRWLAVEGLYYETVRGDPPSALSDVEETELESVLLPSPRQTVTTFMNNSGAPQLSPLATPADVIYEEDFEPYTDDDDDNENSDDMVELRQTAAVHFDQLSSPAMEIKFRVPFPAFVPFPPSPTSSSHAFSLCDSTPFPFLASSVVSTCCCERTCSQSRQATTAQMSVATGDAVKSSLGTQTEKTTFKFVVSVGTQCPLPSSPVHFVSIGTQTDAASIGTQTDAASQSEAEAAAVVCNISAQTEETSFRSMPTSLPFFPVTSVTEIIVAIENDDADYEML